MNGDPVGHPDSRNPLGDLDNSVIHANSVQIAGGRTPSELNILKVNLVLSVGAVPNETTILLKRKLRKRKRKKGSGQKKEKGKVAITVREPWR